VMEQQFPEVRFPGIEHTFAKLITPRSPWRFSFWCTIPHVEFDSSA
jgi:hypothetical protein